MFLSGGVTMLPGFSERLEGELTKLAPPGVPVEVSTYHAYVYLKFMCVFVDVFLISVL